MTSTSAYLIKCLHSGPLNEVPVALGDAPVDLPIQLAWLRHPEEVLLAVKCVKQGVQPCCDVPPPLRSAPLMSRPSRRALMFHGAE